MGAELHPPPAAMGVIMSSIQKQGGNSYIQIASQERAVGEWKWTVQRGQGEIDLKCPCFLRTSHLEITSKTTDNFNNNYNHWEFPWAHCTHIMIFTAATLWQLKMAISVEGKWISQDTRQRSHKRTQSAEHGFTISVHHWTREAAQGQCPQKPWALLILSGLLCFYKVFPWGKVPWTVMIILVSGSTLFNLCRISMQNILWKSNNSKRGNGAELIFPLYRWDCGHPS